MPPRPLRPLSPPSARRMHLRCRRVVPPASLPNDGSRRCRLHNYSNDITTLVGLWWKTMILDLWQWYAILFFFFFFMLECSFLLCCLCFYQVVFFEYSNNILTMPSFPTCHDLLFLWVIIFHMPILMTHDLCYFVVYWCWYPPPNYQYQSNFVPTPALLSLLECEEVSLVTFGMWIS